MTLHIASGECAADSLRKILPDAKILPFNEAMCEGESCTPIYGDRFCELRAAAYGISVPAYLQKSPRDVLQTINKYDRIELYFDGDMFCAANAVTLLAYLEQEKYGGVLRFNLLKQDGSVKNKPMETGVAVFDRALPLLSEYRQDDNEIVRFAREHSGMNERDLIGAMLKRFQDYGLSDIAAKRFILKQQKQ